MNSLVKFLPISLSFVCLLALSPQLVAQSDAETTIDGDHFSLEGALDLFKEAQSPENFEELLNQENNDVNNLDLNEDGKVDFIQVTDHLDGDVHAIVLQVALNDKESQDIAVIEIEKTGKDEALLQILGDENLYGEQVIVEPVEVSSQLQPSGKGGPSPDITTARIIVNVWGWPSVRFIYQPTYRVYVTPFRYGFYPVYYKPWRPRPFRTFRAAVIPRPHYQVVHTHRVVRAHKIYTPRRRTATVVHHRTTTRIAARPAAPHKGAKVTTTKTVVKKKPNGDHAVGKQKTTTGVVKGKNGKVAGKQKTTTTGTKKAGGQTVKGKKTTTKAGVKTKNGTVKGKKTTTKGVKKDNGKVMAGKKTTRKAKAKPRR